jgi:hypothetical protein
MFSFYNAGSGTNQSNHMYKLGPVHQGVMERGSKTGSFAYLLWPSRIGAYSVVMGKHMANFDTSDFPFSYITLDHEKSFLTPGMNLFSVGTRRDSEKWPKRDKRSDPDKMDLINFELLNPYIVQKVIKALATLKELYEKAAKEQDSVYHKGIRIKRLMLKSTQRYYQLALSVFVGDQVVGRLEQIQEFESIESIRNTLTAKKPGKVDQWVDMAGMIAPELEIEKLMKRIKSGETRTLREVAEGFHQIHAEYKNYAWAWTTGILSEEFGLEISKITTEDLLDLVERWKSDTQRLNKMILTDAGKEFDDTSRIGFGLDGDESVVNRDFQAVRGLPEENNFITGIHQEMELIEKRTAALKERLDGI